MIDLAVVTCSRCGARVTASLPAELLPASSWCGGCVGLGIPLGLMFYSRSLSSTEAKVVEDELRRQAGLLGRS